MALTVGQCRAGRALLDWTMSDLSEAAGVSAMTVSRFESGETVRTSSVDALKTTLSAAGITFIAANETSSIGGEGVRLTSKPE